MELQLFRNQFEGGTFGALFFQGTFVCFTIELPWKDNARNISCIPDGCYLLEIWYTDRFKHHLVVKDVPGRSEILIHPANNALKELRGCIAPVTHLTSIATGILSRKALDKLLLLVDRTKRNGSELYLTITSTVAVVGTKQGLIKNTLEL